MDRAGFRDWLQRYVDGRDWGHLRARCLGLAEQRSEAGQEPSQHL